MWRRAPRLSPKQQWCHLHGVHSSKAIIQIEKAAFYRQYPSSTGRSNNPPLLAGLSFTLPSAADPPQYWSILSPSSLARTAFLQVLAGQHICLPPTARSYPYLSDLHTSPQHAIKYVGFDAERGGGVGGTSVRGAYLSARYESRREETDFSVRDYLTGNTELNALETSDHGVDKGVFREVTKQLNLAELLDMPVANLSNGQTRRARIAKALMSKPELLLLDGPFMGLDPTTLSTLSSVLRGLAERSQPRLVLSLRPEDDVPDWISHVVYLNEHLDVIAQGNKEEVLSQSGLHHLYGGNVGRDTTGFHPHRPRPERLSKDGIPFPSPVLHVGETLVEMSGVKVSYDTKTVLGGWIQAVAEKDRSGLWWSLHRGQRCGIFGPNGSGKTTMLSLITSDHPQTYGLPIKLFGRSRLPKPGEPGISLFELQQRMGHSSPEVHAYFPRSLTVRRTLESAWADAPLSKPRLPPGAKQKAGACLSWFAHDLFPSAAAASEEPWDNLRFGELSFPAQRLALFLRAIVASPDLVILDEAFSGMDEATRDKALLFLSHGETLQRTESQRSFTSHEFEPSDVSRQGAAVMKGLSPEQALLVISHAKEDVPGCVREWICLPEPSEGRAPRTGVLEGPLGLDRRGWDEIWGKGVPA